MTQVVNAGRHKIRVRWCHHFGKMAFYGVKIHLYQSYLNKNKSYEETSVRFSFPILKNL